MAMASGDDAAALIPGDSMLEAEQKSSQPVNEIEQKVRMPRSGEYRKWK
jgi:hypothetical protein